MADPDFTARLIYLVLLGSVIAGYFLVSQRRDLGRMAQHAAIWVLLFLGAIVAVGLWQDIRSDILPRQSRLDGGAISVPRAPDGHFYLTLQINGAPIRFVVDTGATQIVLSREDAVTAGIDPGLLIFSGRAMTANGTVETAPVRLDTVVLEDHVETGVPAVVNGGDLPESLLGMSYLGRFARLEIADGRLLLVR